MYFCNSLAAFLQKYQSRITWHSHHHCRARHPPLYSPEALVLAEGRAKIAEEHPPILALQSLQLHLYQPLHLD